MWAHALLVTKGLKKVTLVLARIFQYHVLVEGVEVGAEAESIRVIQHTLILALLAHFSCEAIETRESDVLVLRLNVKLVDVHLAGGLEAVLLATELCTYENDVEEVSIDCKILNFCRVFNLFRILLEQIRLRE